MTELETTPLSPAEIDRRKLQHLLGELGAEAEEALGSFEIYPIGEDGFVLQRNMLHPMAGNNWVMFDFDDTLAATTAIKKERNRLYKETLEARLGYKVSDDFASGLMRMTDTFSRWEESEGSGRLYHVPVHMEALEWVTHQAKQHLAHEGNDGISEEQLLLQLQLHLDRISRERTEDEVVAEDTDPFYFRPTDKKFILRSKIPWHDDIEHVFLNSMIRPELYHDALDSMRELGALDSIHRTNIAILTFGDPTYQMRKLLNMMMAHPDLPITQIWLTKKPKGAFIYEVMESGIEDIIECDRIVAHLEEDSLESLGSGGGLFSETVHRMTVFDDDPRQIAEIDQVGEEIATCSGTRIVPIRSIRAETKTEHHEDRDPSPTTVDFRTDPSIYQILVNARYLQQYRAMKKHIDDGVLQADYPYFLFVKDRLTALGVTLS